ncbi:MAG: hypothetical protein ACYTG0_46755, partial [Planctomycetota bacterium]
MSRPFTPLAVVLVLCCEFLVAGNATYGQTTLYVDGDATGANDGSSWANAFVDPQGALAVASDGTEIRVAGGTYRPTEPGGSRFATFQLIDG